MGRQSVPDDRYHAFDFSEQVAQETHNFGSADRVLEDVHVELARQRNPADGRKVVAGQGRLEHRRFSARGVGLDRRRELVKTGFVYEYRRSVFVLGFF